MFEFQETVQITLPQVQGSMAQFSESEFRESHGLIVEIAAIHEGVTSNFNEYSASELANSVSSWFNPYPKPIILHHDAMQEPLGRVIGARMDQEADGTPYIKIQAAITDPEAIKKVMDKRYLTGSVGGKASEAVCSICDTDWAAPRESAGPPCRHRRGKAYKGEIATIRMKNVEFKEYSFVNVPADSHSQVKSIKNAEESEVLDVEESWTNPSRFFVLDMHQESIIECFELDADVDLLAEMKKKDASPLYIELKGAFIDAQIRNNQEQDGVNDNKNTTNAIDGIDTNSEENEMKTTDTEVAAEQDDILSVTEALSDDLATAAAEENEDTSSEAQDEVNEQISDEVSEDTQGDESSDAEEAERAQGQEKSSSKDVDAETSEGAPKSREDEEISDEETQVEEQETVSEEAADEPELNESNEDVESPEVAELKAENAALVEENQKLRAALHRTLAERVVDAKISAGVLKVSERAEAVVEHSERTASSLADSLKDLSTMSVVIESKSTDIDLEVIETSMAVDDQDDAVLEGKENSDPSDYFFNLMNGAFK